MSLRNWDLCSDEDKYTNCDTVSEFDLFDAIPEVTLPGRHVIESNHITYPNRSYYAREYASFYRPGSTFSANMYTIIVSIYSTKQHFFRPACLISIDSTKHSMLVTAVWSTNRSMHVRDDHPYVFLICWVVAASHVAGENNAGVAVFVADITTIIIMFSVLVELLPSSLRARLAAAAVISLSSRLRMLFPGTLPLCAVSFTGIPAHSVDFMYVLCIYHKRIISSFHPFDLQHDQCMSHSPEQQS